MANVGKLAELTVRFAVLYSVFVFVAAVVVATGVSGDSEQPVLSSLTPPLVHWNKEDYPNPLKEPEKCGRPKSSLLCDPDGILSPTQANELDSLLQQMTHQAQCLCNLCPSNVGGLEVAIALVRYIYRDYNIPVQSNWSGSSQNFANFLRRQWRYGLCNNTVLILLVSSQNEISISLGKVADSVLNDTLFQNLITNQKTDFATGNMFQGLKELLNGIRHTVDYYLPFASEEFAVIDGSRLLDCEPKASDEVSSSSLSGTSTALLVVSVIVAFVLVITALIVSIILLRNHYSKVDQSPEDENETPNKKRRKLFPTPSGYWTDSKQRPQNTNTSAQTDAEKPNDSSDDNEVENRNSNKTNKTNSNINGYEPCSIVDDEETFENSEKFHLKNSSQLSMCPIEEEDGLQEQQPKQENSSNNASTTTAANRNNKFVNDLELVANICDDVLGTPDLAQRKPKKP